MNWCGLSTLRDHSKNRLPASLRVAWVNSSASVSQLVAAVGADREFLRLRHLLARARD
jgi:hypothetical protein